jgi:hypothetical protein
LDIYFYSIGRILLRIPPMLEESDEPQQGIDNHQEPEDEPEALALPTQ